MDRDDGGTLNIIESHRRGEGSGKSGSGGNAEPAAAAHAESETAAFSLPSKVSATDNLLTGGVRSC